ncbi:MAG: M23 family metallopeptidase [Chloroflexi bacterium]|nr:M23 family metallopeptidase [Chloroflexota bacterium]
MILRTEWILSRLGRLKISLEPMSLAVAVSISVLASALAALPAFADPITYTVAAGDTLSEIADRFGVDEKALARANQISDPDLIREGQKLIIDRPSSAAPTTSPAVIASVASTSAAPTSSPSTSGSSPPSTGLRHVVRPGDNVSTIAETYGVSVRALVQENGLSNPDQIQQGRVLVIPVGRQTASTRGARGIDLIWPMRGNITTYFGERDSVYVGGAHSGLDIAARTGDPVRAAARGRVVTAWKRPDNVGWHLIVDHGGGYATMYSHLSKFLVDVGDFVEQGQIIALAGDTGFSTGPHLHFELRFGGQYQDPLDYLP